MKSQRLLDALGEVDETYTVEAAPPEINRRKHSRVKWVSMAACLCVVLVGGIFALNSIVSRKTEKNYTASSMAEISSSYSGVLLANNLSFADASSKKILLSYAGDGSPYNAEDWNTLSVSAQYADCAVLMNCIFNGTAAGTNTEDVLDIIQYGNVSVYLYRDESASGYDYAYRAEFEYGGVFYALHTNSNDPFRIYSVLQTVIGASQTDEPNSESNTFSNILGLNGYYVKIEETPPGFMNWRYFAELDGKTQCVAEVFGYTASGPEVYGKDIDGDGVKELISNCTFGTGTSRVYAYRNNNGVIEQGRLVYDTGDASLFPNLNDWGTNAIQETYDPENGTFIISYDTQTGTGQTVFQDMSRISFQQFRPDT